MNAFEGPEYLPLPTATPGQARKVHAVSRAAAGVPPQAAVAVLAAAMAGFATWIAGGRHAPVPASPRFEMRPMTREAPKAAIQRSPAPLLEQAAASPASARARLPEPPTVRAPVSAPRATAYVHPGASLFNQHIGGFVPFKDQK